MREPRSRSPFPERRCHVVLNRQSWSNASRLSTRAFVMYCNLCESPTADFGALRILGRFDARYRRCKACGFTFAENVSWLGLAYSSAIAASDTGIAVRNLKLAQMTSLLIALAFHDAKRFLDYGGGSGLLVRLMRDRGFDFWLRDKYCPNVFAGGFEAQEGDRFDLATCMEVAEHLPDPMPTFKELATLAPALVLSTELLPETANRPGEWWYYAPETGQHVSFYTVAALRVIAERLQMRVATNGANLHVLSVAPVSDSLIRLVSSRRGRVLASLAVRLAGRRRRSLTQTDADKWRSTQRASDSHAQADRAS